MSRPQPAITVIGSINMDLVVRCDNLPRPGQTVLAESSKEVCGGKGANQAVAAARAGGRVTMVGRVGDDAFADRLVANLANEGIRTEFVRQTPDCASGLAVVAVEQSGQNSILVVPGANGRVTGQDLAAAADVIASSDVILLQMEIPLQTVQTAIQMANRAGVRVILDPAPAPSRWPAELFRADLMCPNESEATALTGTNIVAVQNAESAARVFHDRGCPRIAITLGEQGTLLSDTKLPDANNVRWVEPYVIHAVDTTAAGDAFAGAVAVRWAEDDDLAAAVRFGNAAGALSASRTWGPAFDGLPR